MTEPGARALIETMLNPAARIDERDDAAMDLSSHNDPRVLDALARVASDPSEHHLVVASAGESLAELWLANSTVDREVYGRLTDTARDEVRGLLGARRPDLLARLEDDPA
jgi:hypothetical protein